MCNFRTAKKGKVRRRKPIISSVIDEVVYDGSVKTKKVRSIDPYNEGYGVVGYGCAPLMAKKMLAKTTKNFYDINKELDKPNDVSSVERMVDRVVVNQAVAGDEKKARTDLVIDMPYSRLRVNRSKVKRKKGYSKNTNEFHGTILILPKATNSIAEPQSPALYPVKSNLQLIPVREIMSKGCDLDIDVNEFQQVSSCSPSTYSDDVSEIFTTANYTTPVKNKVHPYTM